MKLVSISEPFNSGTLVELKFVFPECGPIKSGTTSWCIDAAEASKWMIGDRFFNHIRGL